MNRKYTVLFLLVLGIGLLLFSEGAAAVNYDREIRETEKEQKTLEKKAEELQEELEEIQKSREDTMLYIEKLDKKTAELEQELELLEGQMREVKTGLAKLQEELSGAEAERQKQYTTMKKRIKYMYENGNQQYMAILFDAESITDLLNRSEYIEKIAGYDRSVFARYRQIENTVRQKQKKKQEKLQEMNTLKEQTETEKQTVNKMTKSKKTRLKEINRQAKKTGEQIDEYMKQAIAAENKVEELLREKQEEIDREMAAGSGNSGEDEKGLRWPLKGGAGRISSGFGPRKRPTAVASSNHRGLDLAIASGTPILAAGKGSVVTAAYSRSAGNYVMISHGNRLYTVYMHCSRLAVRVGEQVSKGQVIAYVGSTGISTGPHLHFGVSKNGKYVNPLNFISG